MFGLDAMVLLVLHLAIDCLYLPIYHSILLFEWLVLFDVFVVLQFKGILGGHWLSITISLFVPRFLVFRLVLSVRFGTSLGSGCGHLKPIKVEDCNFFHLLK